MELLQKYPGESRANGYYGWATCEHFGDHNHVFSALTRTSFDNLASVRVGSFDPRP